MRDISRGQNKKKKKKKKETKISVFTILRNSSSFHKILGGIVFFKKGGKSWTNELNELLEWMNTKYTEITRQKICV